MFFLLAVLVSDLSQVILSMLVHKSQFGFWRKSLTHPSMANFLGSAPAGNHGSCIHQSKYPVKAEGIDHSK